MTKRIFTLKLRDIHETILSAENITQASKHLNVSIYDIELLLYYLPHPETGEYLNLKYDEIKEHWEDTAAGENFWKDKYDQTVPEVQGDLKTLNLFALHQLIHGASGIKSFKSLAIHLKLTPNQVKKYLEGFTVHLNNEAQTLNFEILLSLDDDAAFRKALHLDTDIQQQVIVNKFVRQKNVLSPKPQGSFFFVNECSQISDLIGSSQETIFKTLIQSKSFQVASLGLGSPDRLSHYLRKILMISGSPWQHQKHFDSIRHFLGKLANHELPFVGNYSKAKPLKDYRLFELHELILRSESKADLCLFLNIPLQEFEVFMHSSFFCSYQQLYRMCVAECLEAWGLAYYLPIMEVENDRRFSVAEIHQAILASDEVTTAESMLGVPAQCLNFFLSYLYIQVDMYNVPLSFTNFKSLFPSMNHGKYAYGAAYEQVMRPVYVEVEAISFSELHQIIIESSTVLEAALKLQISVAEFNKQLNYLTYWQDSNLTSLNYYFIKTNWPDVISAYNAWGEDYFKTLGALKKEHEVSYALISRSAVQPNLFNNKKRKHDEDQAGPRNKQSRHL